MNSNGDLGVRIVKILFSIFAIGISLYLVLGQLVLPKETDSEVMRCEEFDSSWVLVMNDGSKKAINVPGQCDVKPGETMIIESVMPADITNKDCLCVRTANQDMKIYINGELRKEYSTVDSRPFGKTSSSRYIFVPLERADAGKIIQIKSVCVSAYSGVVQAMYYGDKTSIWFHIFVQGGIESMVAIFILILGIAGAAITSWINYKYGKDLELKYLCWGVFLLAVWMVGQSNIRQIIFLNISVANSITYFSIMLMPIPFMIYANAIQKNRYKRIYTIVEVLSLINFVVCSLIQIFDIRDFAEIIVLIFGIILVDFTWVIVTFCMDWKKGLIREYKFVVIGFVGAIAMSTMQMVVFFNKTVPPTTIYMTIGVLLLMLMSGISSVGDIIKIDYEKQVAINSNESKARFLANMSHEIRTPINAILGMDEIILRESQETSTKEYANDIKSAGKTLLSLINDILDFSKMESGKMEIHPMKYRTASLVSDCYSMVSMNASEKNLDFVVEVDENIPTSLVGDEVRVRQIIVNLLTNAVKYTKEGSITFRVGGKYIDNENFELKIDVIDTGIGIKKENLKSLFDLFARFDARKNSSVEGSGLGLNIVSQLVELMSGEITVDSRYGEGSTFSVSIPQRVMDAQPIGKFSANFGNKRELDYVVDIFTAPEANILVVDDVEMNVKVMRGLLKRIGVNVDACFNGKETLLKVAKKKYDIIFLDHMMPEMDGIEVFNIMRTLPDNKNADTPVIMLTANAVGSAKQEYIELGFTDYLSKPIRDGRLEEMLRKYLPSELIVEVSDEEKAEEEEEPLDIVQPLSKYDFLDTDTGLMYCGGDETFYMEVLSEYARQNLIDELNSYYESMDWENYRIKVHALKGTSQSIGATQMYNKAKSVEMALKKGDIKFAKDNHVEMMQMYMSLLERFVN